jgi:hypothetical protein
LAPEIEAPAGRPAVATEIRQLIREISIANPLWGAPRIHGELLKLGIDIGQTSVAKYMARRKRGVEPLMSVFIITVVRSGFIVRHRSYAPLVSSL